MHHPKLDRPFEVVAPSPWNPQQNVVLHVNRSWVGRMAQLGLKEAYGQYFGLILGIACLTHADLSVTLEDTGDGLGVATRAVFQGLQRPMGSAAWDTGVFVYVSNPKANYTWVDHIDPALSGPYAWRNPKPANSVFTTFVRFVDAEGKTIERESEMSATPPQGFIESWEWTFGSPTDASLPDDYDHRYARRMW